MKRINIIFLAAILIIGGCTSAQTNKNKYPNPPKATDKTIYPMRFSEAEWKARLTESQYYILRQDGTERAGTGKYDHFYQKGTYYSAATL